jgi:hypothetical protein
MTTLTDKELAVLDHIALNSFQPTNYSRPESYDQTSAIWANCITDSSSKRKISKESVPGVVSSLQTKGLVNCCDGDTRREDTIRMTQAGFDTWNKATS